MKQLFLLLILAFCTHSLAIVTIKPMDINEKPLGFSGELSLSSNSNRGNSDTDATDTGVYLQYDRNNSLIFLKSSYKYGKTLDVKNIDKSFIHLRRIHKLVSHLDDEQFMQQQSDTFQSLNSRTLGGMGLRVSMGNPKKSGRIYIGLGAFYLTEKEVGSVSKDYGRGNLYISYKFAPQKRYDFSLVSYYQPRVNQSHDYLQLSTAELNLAFNKQFSIKFSVEYNVNSLPEVGVKAYDYSQKTALKYTF